MSHPKPTSALAEHGFSVGSLERKVANKTALQAALGWVKEPKRPMLCLPCGMTEKLGGKLLEELLPGLVHLDCEMLIVGKGTADYGKTFTDLQKKHGHRVKIVKNDADEIQKMLAAADMALFLAEGSEDVINDCLRFGVVPVSVHSPILADYNPVQESGNAFMFQQEIVWHAFAALVRAMETFKFPYDWRTIQRHAMESAQR